MERPIKPVLLTEDRPSDIVATFEKVYARMLGMAGTIGTPSGTSALVLALETLDIGPGDEVLLPSYTCLSVANAVLQVGAKPVPVDSHYTPRFMDYNASLAGYNRCFHRGKTKAVIIPHCCGIASPFPQLEYAGIPIIEDITTSFGACVNGKMIGSMGDLSVCSFHPSKMLGIGEGGALACKTPELLAKARWLNGWATDPYADQIGRPYRLRYDMHLHRETARQYYRIEELPELISGRRKLARRYTERLSDIPGVIVPEVYGDDGTNVFYRYLIALENGGVEAKQAEFKERGVMVGRGVWPAVHQFLGLPDDDFPNTMRVIESVLSIPLYNSLRTAEVAYILDVCDEVLR